MCYYLHEATNRNNDTQLTYKICARRTLFIKSLFCRYFFSFGTARKCYHIIPTISKHSPKALYLIHRNIKHFINVWFFNIVGLFAFQAFYF